MSLVALSELLGAPVRGATGAVLGRVREIAIAPQDHPTRIAYLIVRTADGERVLPSAVLKSCGATVRTADDGSAWEKYSASDGVLLLKRDLLDQQIIDVHGRKVVRVNDVELDSTPVNSHVVLSVVAVDVGARGAIRRLTKGIVPSFTLRTLLARIPPRVIPWAYVDLLETDPARRVKLKIVYEGLSKLHPADIANIVEDLPHAEREAVFETLDEEVAAEALEELDPEGPGLDRRVAGFRPRRRHRRGNGPRRRRRPARRAAGRPVGRNSQGDGAGGAPGSRAAPRVRRAHRRRPHDDRVRRRRRSRGRGRRDRGAAAVRGQPRGGRHGLPLQRGLQDRRAPCRS